MSAPFERTPPEDEGVHLSVEESSVSTVEPFGGQYTPLQFNIKESVHVQHYGKSSHILPGLMDDGTRVMIKKRPISEITSSRPEKEILSKLSAPFIVRVQCYMEDKEFSYMVLESVNSTLEERIQNVSQHTNTEETKAGLINLTVQVLEGLNFLHQKKYLHGDVTHRNVLVDGEGQPRWIDFTSSAEVTCGEGRKMEDEIRRAGELAYYILSGGENHTGHNTSRDVDDLQWDFIKWMTEEKKSLKEALDHPVFWKKNRKLRYLEALGNLKKEATKKLQHAFLGCPGSVLDIWRPPSTPPMTFFSIT
ncbi:mannose-P-dolichol utilization defect 1a isoform X1 [Ictalurus punctatus]|uniref:Mannose-P-dolichol utilization defect 1a isoform X1 n=1 Tax=Ictalurus punctatus TaxID=7998 RepID=A0A2D0QEC1_ICTPU|nr:mannose-P-dolichol utilization defect 1a isoform X1 [Ictalurus punctatus]